MVKSRIQTHPREAYMVDRMGATPLGYAISFEAPTSVFRRLLKDNAGPCRMYDDEGMLAIHAACALYVNVDCMRNLLERCPETSTARTIPKADAEERKRKYRSTSSMPSSSTSSLVLSASSGLTRRCPKQQQTEYPPILFWTEPSHPSLPRLSSSSDWAASRDSRDSDGTHGHHQAQTTTLFSTPPRRPSRSVSVGSIASAGSMNSLASSTSTVAWSLLVAKDCSSPSPAPRPHPPCRSRFATLSSGPDVHHSDRRKNVYTPLDCIWNSRSDGCREGRRLFLDPDVASVGLLDEAQWRNLRRMGRGSHLSGDGIKSPGDVNPSAHIVERRKNREREIAAAHAPLREFWGRVSLLLLTAYRRRREEVTALSSSSMAAASTVRGGNRVDDDKENVDATDRQEGRGSTLGLPPPPHWGAGSRFGTPSSSQPQTRTSYRVVHAALSIPCAPLEVVLFTLRAFPHELRERDADGDLPLHLVARGEECAPRRWGWTDGGRGEALLPLLAGAYPPAARLVDAGGRLPLHLALEAGHRFHRPNSKSGMAVWLGRDGEAGKEGAPPLSKSLEEGDGSRMRLDGRDRDAEEEADAVSLDEKVEVYDTGVSDLLHAYPEAVHLRDPASGLYPAMVAAASSGKDIADLNTVYELLLTDCGVVEEGIPC